MPRKTPRQRQPPKEAELDAAEARSRRAAQARGVIPGIHNYCDRWCERCPKTAHCSVFQLAEVRPARKGHVQTKDADNQEFWDEIATSLAVALRMIRREAKRRGLDLDDPDLAAEAAIDERRRARQAAREGSVLHHGARAYREAATRLIEALPEELRATEDALNVALRFGTGTPQEVAAGIVDALGVVEWYLLFIDVKLQRAVSSRVDVGIEGMDGLADDADGSAKIALIAIDRTIGAWLQLREHLVAHADAILDLLVRLERLRCEIEREFPRARAFKRPGFD